ncbi:hypothetical protein KSP40_PGU022768 [Platanthera guangdongensis]|uniref:Uncharacterized protein n=1 Tax=Platanthera guangdongensis TaxID=2320717 RepID=A0ABR2MJC2_9ASPA
MPPSRGPAAPTLAATGLARVGRPPTLVVVDLASAGRPRRQGRVLRPWLQPVSRGPTALAAKEPWAALVAPREPAALPTTPPWRVGGGNALAGGLGPPANWAGHFPAQGRGCLFPKVSDPCVRIRAILLVGLVVIGSTRSQGHSALRNRYCMGIIMKYGCLQFCHEGKYLASSSNDSSVIIWEAVKPITSLDRLPHLQYDTPFCFILAAFKPEAISDSHSLVTTNVDRSTNPDYPPDVIIQLVFFFNTLPLSIPSTSLLPVTTAFV